MKYKIIELVVAYSIMCITPATKIMKCITLFLSLTLTCRQYQEVAWLLVPLVEQELPTLPGHLSSPLVFSGVRVTRSLVLCVCFVDRCSPFCRFSDVHCVVCSSSIYRFWLPLWYLQTIFTKTMKCITLFLLYAVRIIM